MKHCRFISGSLLVQTGPDAFVHLNITANPPPGKSTVNASIVGPHPTQDELRTLVQVVLDHLQALERADIEPRRIVVPQ